jgi:hypothetical protein
MLLLIRQLDGSVQPAILMATMENRIRVVMPGCDDIVELSWTNGQWFSEHIGSVAIEFDPAPPVFDGSVRRNSGLAETQQLFRTPPDSGQRPEYRQEAPAPKNTLAFVN